MDSGIIFTACTFLGVFGLVAITRGFRLGPPAASTYERERERRQVRKPYLWLGLGVLLWVLAGGVLILVGLPALNRERVAEAVKATHETFRQNMAATPEEVHFDPTDRKLAGENWRLEGTARTGGFVYDVTVVNKTDGRQNVTESKAVRR